jgi:VWFA-related protein
MRAPQVPFAAIFVSTISFAQTGVPAQTASLPAQEVSTHDAPAAFTSRTNLVQVPVVVRDKQGHPIGNLTKDDFFVFDKGKPQYITKFTVEKAGTPFVPAVVATDESVPDRTPASAAPIPERFIAYMIDDVHLTTGDLLRVRKAATEHIDRTLDAVTRVAIVTTSGIGVLDFTDDLDKIHEALNRIQPNMRTPNATGDCPYINLYLADLIVNKSDPGATGVAIADAQACTSSVNTVDLQSLVRTAAISALSIGETETTRAMNGLQSLMERMSGVPGSRTIVLISPGFLLPGDDLRPAEMALLERAIRLNVTINTLDARGVYTIIPGGDASTRTISTSSMTARASYESSAALAQQDILEELASGTGGNFFRNDNGVKEGLDQLGNQPEFVYVLGFSPADLKYDGSIHSLKVSLRDSAGRTLQARRAYYAPKRPSDPAEAAKEDIREQVFSRDEIQDIPVELRLQFFKSTPVNARVTVISRVDVKNLRFRKDQDRSKNTLTLVAGLFDRNGNFVSGMQRIVEMNLRDQTLQTLDTSGLTVRTNFDVTPGNYTIRVVVRDAEGQMMAARNGAVQVP